MGIIPGTCHTQSPPGVKSYPGPSIRSRMLCSSPGG
jgi:hypothetical protein